MDRNLRAFLAVVRAGNLTSAAHVIGLTQPALTKTIRRLEQEFGAELFGRTTRGMILTEVGSILLARAQAIEMHYKQAFEEVRAAITGTVAQFSIGAGAAYQMTIAPDLVKQLSAEFTETNFVLDFDVAGATLPQLMAGEIDLMLGAFHNVPPEGIETKKVFQVEMTPYCCRSHPLARLKVVRPKDLRDCEWIIYKRDRLIAEHLAAYCADHTLPAPTIRVEVDALVASFRIVSGSKFLTLAPTALEEVAASVGLVRLSLQHPIWKFASGAWFRKSAKDYPVMRRTLHLLPLLARDAMREGHSLKLEENELNIISVP